ncbi:hypothetical protein AGMMS49949_05720 [Alphaproteobacteria bacterium]|nr:hypothetical protein AGMMS49949_05720 [Alphaproteobacteria bacterium]GHS97693.1 hypothetical protein AGMMS50296_4890 [Alphaproteobacteria bacterium]
MAILTKSGRTALAVSLKVQPVHLAWGAGEATWETSHAANLVFDDNRISLPHAPVKNVVLTADATTFNAGEDTAFDMTTGIITRLNSDIPDIVSLSYAIATPQESIQATALLNEVGRRIVDEVSFCVGDSEGLLVTPTGRFSVTTEPTNQLYFHCTFDFADGSHETIRELGIFMGTEVSETCPLGQRYFVPSELTNPGILLVCENTVPLIRTEATREAFSFVVTV